MCQFTLDVHGDVQYLNPLLLVDYFAKTRFGQVTAVPPQSVFPDIKVDSHFDTILRADRHLRQSFFFC